MTVREFIDMLSNIQEDKKDLPIMIYSDGVPLGVSDIEYFMECVMVY